MTKPDANGWMPIETAPKDGTQILTFSPHGTVICEWLPAGYFREGDAACWFPIVNPTHWQPLPEPPVERSKSKEQATDHASTSPGPVNCQIRKRFQKEAYPRTCERCGLGPCPFFHDDGRSKLKEQGT